ncbi:MAG: restriction endonuclease [Candidatus Mcinerneyibacterium aminivorans]|uniref:Restriction endonuclease n=1 Tax=Candidatus Mcinerneyibacterium aminivorans TaxID=2703815 RepID=A0A5D0MJ61_9BACT|nr:MAG: restriction endonuclease [Candidatus Mcinerneyibacterium aminivorans]
MKNNKYFTITEFGYIARGKKNYKENNTIFLKKKYFKEIEQFILQNKEERENQLSEFITITYHKNYKKCFQAKNYVGVIQLKNGITLEILPKIYLENEENNYERIRKTFLTMLKALKDAPFKKFGITGLKTEKMHLHEVFISMFLEELFLLIKRGLRSSYQRQKKNSKYLKGKLLVGKHVVKNAVHKNRFYVSYDEFNQNRPENRTIKSTLYYLQKVSYSNENQKKIKELLFRMDSIKKSKNIEKDLKSCVTNRLMSHYNNILLWCEVFLKNKSFTNFKGSSISYALLFPMEKIFEDYIAYKLKKQNEFPFIRTQHSRYHLAQNIQNENDIFRLIPDIYARTQDYTFIIDTKWKLLDREETNYSISQSDFYQLFSYSKIYRKEGKKVVLVLIYPQTKSFREIKEFKYHDKENVKMIVYPVDLNKKEVLNDLQPTQF